MIKKVIILSFLLMSCTHKPRYQIWGVSKGEIGQDNLSIYRNLKQNPLYWDCEYRKEPYMPSCKVCIDTYKEFYEDREVDPKLCKSGE